AGWCIYLVILCGAFALPLREFIAYARHSEVHSYVLLIPFVTAYLIYLRWKSLSHELSSSLGFALLLAAAGIGALLASQHFSDLVVSHQRYPFSAQRNALSASRNNHHGGQRM